MLSVTGKQEVNVLIDDREMGHALIRFVRDKWLDKDFDDAGCDWMTSEDGNKVCIGGLDWVVIESTDAVSLVDAANILTYGKKLIVN
ncbi:hypothetical protein Q5W88_21530 [Shouchella clausii]|uniref:hypothetical protein n=1 Tax=Shouchella clausii TaxID=79880 RepID=UPI0026F4615F|nr:hypothetical protein [Shouchella clausii]MDO7285888.1 hypothetical protein [Shouchella clausii]MDO7305791.1 hypothetical protein [Shouchella clausii]